MRIPRSFIAFAGSCLLVGALAMACGGGGGDDAPPDADAIPTATLPAQLPEPVIVSGGVVQPGGGTTYTIKSGDTFASVAARFGVLLEDLLAANPGVNPSTLNAGDVIKLPTDVPRDAPTSTAEPEPTEDDATAAATEEPTSTPEPEPTATSEPVATATTSSLGQTYIVQSGDIPVAIAEKFGITVEALLAANPGIDPRGLQVGQVLTIPPPPAPDGG